MKRTTKLLIGLALGLATLAGVLVTVTNNVAAAAGQEPTSSTVSDATSSGVEEAYAEGVVDIVLGDSITISGEGATVNGNTVNITAAGVYSISGTLSEGRIDVDAEGKVYLEFNGVEIISGSGPALSITDAKKVTITLVEGTTNSLTDSNNDDGNDAALFTNDTLIINGGGTLVVTGNNNEGISSDDDIIINAGTIKVTAVDDGLNAHDDITITGGDIHIVAGGDGIDSNGTVNINGGTLVSFGSTAEGDGGLDAIGDFVITGGTVVIGGNSVAAPSGESTQPSLYVVCGSTQATGTLATVAREGKEILAITPDKEFRSIFVSSGDLVVGGVYEVYVGGTAGASTSVTAAIAPAGTGAMDMPADAADAGIPATGSATTVPAAE